MRLLAAFAALLYIISCGSCSSTSPRKAMSHIEKYAREYPDSALKALQSIDTAMLHCRKDKAKYALMIAETADMSLIDTSDVNLMTAAVNYYSHRGSPEQKCWSLYYQGRIYENAGNYASAIISFTKAVALSDKIKDDRLRGMLYSELGNMYRISYDYEEAVSYSRKEYELFSSIGGRYDIHLAKFNYADDCIGAGLVGKADSLFQSLLAADDIEPDLYADIRMSYAVSQAKRNSRMALELFEDVIADDKERFQDDPQVIGAYAYTLARCGEIGRAIDIIGSIKDTYPSDYYCWIHYIDSLRGDYAAAYRHLLEFDNLGETELREILRTSLVKVQRDNFWKAHELYLVNQRVMRLRTVLMGIAIAVLAVLILSMFLEAKRRKRLAAERIQTIIAAARHEFDELSDRIENKDNDLAEMERKFDKEKEELRNEYISRYKDLFSQVKNISSLLINNESRHIYPEQKKAAAEVGKVVKFIYADKEGQEAFEKNIDMVMDNIMSSFRKNLPGLPEDDYRLFGYLCAGFNLSEISVLMCVQSPNAIYSRKYRLIVKVRELPDDMSDKVRFIQILSK